MLVVKEVLFALIEPQVERPLVFAGFTPPGQDDLTLERDGEDGVQRVVTPHRRSLDPASDLTRVGQPYTLDGVVDVVLIEVGDEVGVDAIQDVDDALKRHGVGGLDEGCVVHIEPGEGLSEAVAARPVHGEEGFN